MPIINDHCLNVAILENSYLPRYEDALKLPATTPRDLEVTTRAAGVVSMPHPAINEPPPFYENSTSAINDERHQTANLSKFYFLLNVVKNY